MFNLEDLMKNIRKLFILFLFIFVFSSVYLYSETQQKTDFKIGAKIIGVADPEYKEYSYIDIGSAHGVKPGDRFMVEGKYGKVMVEVVQSFQRMSSVRIVDSWLLNEGNAGEMIPSSRYPKIRIAKYVEKAKKDTVIASAKLKPKKSKPKVSAEVEKPKETKKVESKKQEILPEEVSAEALIPEESIEVVTPSFEGVPEEQGEVGFPEMETGGAELLTEIPGEEMPVGEMETALPGEEALPVTAEQSMEEIGMPSDIGMDSEFSAGESSMPTDIGMESGFPAEEPGLPVEEPGLPAEEPGLPVEELGLPAEEPGLPVEELGLPAEEPGLLGDSAGMEPDLPSDDMSIMPGDALPPMP